MLLAIGRGPDLLRDQHLLVRRGDLLSRLPELDGHLLARRPPAVESCALS